MPENNLKQCYRLESAEVLDNPYGSAPGLFLKKEGKILVMLPGPAREMHPMFEQQVVPRLQKEGVFPEIDCYLQLRTAGIGESSLAEIVDPVLSNIDGLIVGYCAHAGMVDLRLSSLDSDILSEEKLQQLGNQCRELLGEDFVCFGDRSLAEVIFRELRSLNKTLAVAESCTGGLLSSQFTEIAGISKVFHGGAVCYHNDAKVQLVEVPESMLEQHGAVSEEVAIAMATGACEKFGADYGLSVTGFAGPTGGTQILPIGSIYLGYASRSGFGRNNFISVETVPPIAAERQPPPSTGCAASSANTNSKKFLLPLILAVLTFNLLLPRTFARPHICQKTLFLPFLEMMITLFAREPRKFLMSSVLTFRMICPVKSLTAGPIRLMK